MVVLKNLMSWLFLLQIYLYNWIVRSCSYIIYLYMVFLTLFYMFSEILLEHFSMFFTSFQTH